MGLNENEKFKNKLRHGENYEQIAVKIRRVKNKNNFDVLNIDGTYCF